VQAAAPFSKAQTSFPRSCHAETALAVALKQEATAWASPQDIHFCSGLKKEEERNCRTGWLVRSALAVLAAAPPKTPSCLPYAPRASNPCAYKCRSINPDVSTGAFKTAQLLSEVDIQQWIRQHGPVVTSMQLYKDNHDTFFEKNPGGIYKGPGVEGGALNSDTQWSDRDSQQCQWDVWQICRESAGSTSSLANTVMALLVLDALRREGKPAAHMS